jgi:hypothetical protein
VLGAGREKGLVRGRKVIMLGARKVQFYVMLILVVVWGNKSFLLSFFLPSPPKSTSPSILAKMLSPILFPALIPLVLAQSISQCHFPAGPPLPTSNNTFFAAMAPCSAPGLSTICCATNRTNPPGGDASAGETRDECLPNGVCRNRKVRNGVEGVACVLPPYLPPSLSIFSYMRQRRQNQSCECHADARIAILPITAPNPSIRESASTSAPVCAGTGETRASRRVRARRIARRGVVGIRGRVVGGAGRLGWRRCLGKGLG